MDDEALQPSPVQESPFPPPPLPRLGASTADAPEPAQVPGERRRVLAYGALVLACWLLMCLWGLGKAPFHTKGEPREGLVVWEMTHGGGWILPLRNGVEVPSKPPLFHWLGAAASLVQQRTDEWSIRLPSALLSLLSLWCALLAGARLWGARAGLFAALSLMSMFEWSRAAVNARVDMTLTFGLQAAFLCLLFFFRSRSSRWLLPLYLSIAVAVLGKGFVGAVLPGLVALAVILLRRDWRLIVDLRLVRGALIVSAIAGLWYVLAVAVGGWSFFQKQILGEQLFTFVNNPESGWQGHRHSLLYLPGALLLGLLPWTPFFVAVGWELWRELGSRRDTTTTIEGLPFGASIPPPHLGLSARIEFLACDPRVYLLVWIFVVLGFYELAAQKRSVYLLALYPAAALLLGWWWDEATRRATTQAWLASLARWLGLALTVALVPILLVAVLEALGAPILSMIAPLLSRSDRLTLPGIAEAMQRDRLLLALLLPAALMASYTLARVARQGAWLRIFAALFATTLLLQVTVRLVFLPGIARHQTFRDLMTDVRARVGDGADLKFYNAFEYGAVFYYGGHIPRYKGNWPIEGPAFVLLTASEWERRRDEAMGLYTRIELPSDMQDKVKEPLVLVQRVPTSAGNFGTP